MITYREISLGQISPNPNNPRKRCDPKALEELAASIKAKGVLEPIIVRPAGKAFEIVAGERRYRASKLAGLAEIPAIVRELTDDEAFDIMIIENIQRSDLTDREEAESFKSYVAHHKGEDGILALAEKTGITPAYIRSRIRVLELPAKVLKAWDAGDISFGHLQQLLRIKDSSELTDTFDKMINWGMTVRKLAAHIDKRAPALSSAFFDTKGCSKCPANSTVQRELFGVETKAARCLDPVCFKNGQNEYLSSHWKDTPLAKKHGTNGFRFEGRNDLNDFGWRGKPGAKCKACPNFVTEIDISGKVAAFDGGQSCAGEDSCFIAVTRARSTKEKSSGERDPEAPRASWHGEFFRDKFLRPRIEAKVADLHVPVSDAIVLLLAAAVKARGSYAVDEKVEKALGIDVTKVRAGSKCEAAIEAILKLKGPAVEKVAKAVLLWIIQDGKNVDRGYTQDGFGTANRAAIGTFLGIDLAKEYAVDAEYLEKKTKAEILAFLKKFNLGGKFGDLETAAKLKKPELVKGILSLGDKLVGKVPAEILK
jgi:ParB/RepB/Spo0J family partition protein